MLLKRFFNAAILEDEVIAMPGFHPTAETAEDYREEVFNSYPGAKSWLTISAPANFASEEAPNFAAAGYLKVDTGGNCEAWYRRSKCCKFHALITNADLDCSKTFQAHEIAYVGLYDEETGDPVDCGELDLGTMPVLASNAIAVANALLGYGAERSLEEMAASAVSLNESDWGSDRQVSASNAFFARCEELYPSIFAEGSPFMQWALKATDVEMVGEAMRLIDVYEKGVGNRA